MNSQKCVARPTRTLLATCRVNRTSYVCAIESKFRLNISHDNIACSIRWSRAPFGFAAACRLQCVWIYLRKLLSEHTTCNNLFLSRSALFFNESYSAFSLHTHSGLIFSLHSHSVQFMHAYNAKYATYFVANRINVNISMFITRKTKEFFKQLNGLIK